MRELPEAVRQIILYGTGGEKLELHYDQPRGKGVLYQPFEGVCQQSGAPLSGDPVRRQQAGAGGVHVPSAPARPARADRLKPEALAVTVGGLSI